MLPKAALNTYIGLGWLLLPAVTTASMLGITGIYRRRLGRLRWAELDLGVSAVATDELSPGAIPNSFPHSRQVRGHSLNLKSGVVA